MRFDDRARFAARDGAVWRELEGRVYVLDGATGDHYETNAVGGLVFRLAAEGREVDAIREALFAAFAVERSTLDADLASYLSALLERGLLVVADDSAGH